MLLRIKSLMTTHKFKFFSRFSYSSQEADNVFRPVNTMVFRNVYKINQIFFFPIQGYHELFHYKDYNYARMLYLILGGSLSLVGFWALRKIYNYHERNWIGIVLYSFVSFWSLKKTYQLSYHFRRIIMQEEQLDLKDCGRFVRLTHPSFISTKIQKTYDIATVKNASEAANYRNQYTIHFAYPVSMNKDFYNFPRDGGILLNKEVMPQILNSKYIDTSERVEEI